MNEIKTERRRKQHYNLSTFITQLNKGNLQNRVRANSEFGKFNVFQRLSGQTIQHKFT